ncbi:PfkB family carbohydrate kinase [Flavimarina sp. Hel_I_48]|uniref:PfkB family carbohydrate kinase n=1 Tax=Flavimarina sp. Hel_I_48 TaxID=1392488 RepID=UPI0004DF4ACE|nr:PfkB family carbohydrate kinase [Flavimarina sp. Hel_I_48]
MNKLVIVGTCAFDEIESPSGKSGRILGGAATFIGLAASNFDVDPAIVSIVGEDFPQENIDLLKNKGINMDGLEVVKGGKTFFWKGKYHNDLNTRDTLVTELNTLADFQPQVPKEYKDAEIVMLGNLHPMVQLSVLQQMDAKPKLAILDTMNFWMDSALEDLKKVIAEVDVITINDEEARQLSGEYSLVTAAKKIHEMGPRFVVIKKGEHGALLFEGDDIFFAPALPLEEVFDPTGAGDTFAGGFAGYLCQTDDLSFDNMKRAVIHGSNLASFCVEKFGTERMQDLSEKELTKRLLRFKKLTQFDIEVS